MAKDEKETRRDDWDLESAKLVKPSKRSRRIVFSVQFSQEEFDEVSRRAKEAGMKPGAYIRETVLNCGAVREASPLITGGSPENTSQITYSGGVALVIAMPTGQLEVRA